MQEEEEDEDGEEHCRQNELEKTGQGAGRPRLQRRLPNVSCAWPQMEFGFPEVCRSCGDTDVHREVGLEVTVTMETCYEEEAFSGSGNSEVLKQTKSGDKEQASSAFGVQISKEISGEEAGVEEGIWRLNGHTKITCFDRARRT